MRLNCMCVTLLEQNTTDFLYLFVVVLSVSVFVCIVFGFLCLLFHSSLLYYLFIIRLSIRLKAES